jgi:MFS family permease
MDGGNTVNETRSNSSIFASSGWIIAMLALVLFINWVDRGSLGTATPLIKHDLGLTNEQLGRLSLFFFSFYALMQIPSGWLAERYGAHRVLAVGLAIWAVATMLTGLSSSLAMLLILRMLLGIGESAAFPATSKILAAAVPIEQLGAANGICAFAYSVGPAIGILGGGLLIDRVGWRGMFVVFGILSLLWLLPWSFTRLPALANARRQDDADTPSWSQVLRQRGMWGTGLGLFSNNYIFYFMLAWLPDYLVSARHFSMHEMEAWGTASYFVNGFSALFVGWAIDRYVQRRGSANLAYKAVLFVAQIGCIIGMLMMGMGSPRVAIIGLFAVMCLLGASSAGVYTMSQILAGPRAAGRWVGVQNCIGNLSGGFAAWFTGIIVDRTGHFTGAFITAAVIAALGAYCWIGMVPKLAPIDWKSVPGGAAVRPAVTVSGGAA